MFTSDGEKGQFGDVILVNGVPWPVMKVKRRKYRFRRAQRVRLARLQAARCRIGDPFTVICTDGGLMPAPQTVTSMRHVMAERYEIVIDFAKYNPGTKIVLQNRNPPNNIDFPNTDKIMMFEVIDDAFDPADNEIPAVAVPGQPGDEPARRASPVKTRQLEVERAQRAVDDQRPRSGTTSSRAASRCSRRARSEGTVEIWELVNKSGGWLHPFHIHLIDFRILDRNGRPPFAYERGPKDIAYVGEGEKVRVHHASSSGTGKYMMHCHNLVHEDHDMMVQYRTS